MHARVSRAMAQFFLKIAHLSFFDGANATTENGTKLRSPSPVMGPTFTELSFDNRYNVST